MSRMWWEPATRALYTNIVIRRFGQIPTLARTLISKDTGLNLGALVRSITLYECVTFAWCTDVIRTAFETALEQCTRLEELSFHPHPDLSDERKQRGDRFWDFRHNTTPHYTYSSNPVWLLSNVIFPTLSCRNSQTLRRLHLRVDCTWDAPSATSLHRLLTTSSGLRKLTLYVPLIPDHRQLPKLSQPQLEDLTLEIEDYSFDLWLWELPKLKSLTMNDCDELPIRFLESYGLNVTFLNVWRSHHTVSIIDLEQLPQLCPVLEHLACSILPEDILASLHGTTEPFRRLRYLDIWYNRAVTQDPPDFVEIARSSFAPELERMRLLSNLRPHDDLPIICHPSMVTTINGSRLVCVSDRWIEQTAWRVRAVEDWWEGPEGWLEDDSGDYEMSEGDEDNASWTSDGSELENDGDSDVEEQEHPDAWETPRDLEDKQLDWEEVLEAFHNSQGTDISISTAGNSAS